MRLRQIVNNLASNACKFTPTGGKIRIVTRLMLPVLPTFGLDNEEGIQEKEGDGEWMGHAQTASETVNGGTEKEANGDQTFNASRVRSDSLGAPHRTTSAVAPSHGNGSEHDEEHEQSSVRSFPTHLSLHIRTIVGVHYVRNYIIFRTTIRT